MARILHLSDVHLGNDIILRSLLRQRSWRNFVNASITNGLANAIRQLQPDFIVLSGDLVNKPHPSSFRIAATYLRDLFSKAGFDMNERLLIIPGNHDVSFFPKKAPDDLARLHSYRMFLLALFNESDFEARKQRYVRIDVQRRLIFVCFDSTLKNHAPLAEGEIGLNQREWAKRKLATLSKRLNISEYTKIAVLHHHCVPIAGTTTSSERAMQLLDAGDVLRMFDECGFHLVLHGHKHVPHTDFRMRSDSSVWTIVGAGTATCAFVDEQQGFGNNFNLITISPENNEVQVQLYQADQNGVFESRVAPKAFSLSRVTPLGYTVREVLKFSSIAQDGTVHITVVKNGLRVTERGKTMHTLPLRVVAPAVSSKISGFNFLANEASPQFVVRGDRMIEGEWLLNKPLTYTSDPIDISYSYTLAAGTAMSKVEFAKMYTCRPVVEESTSVSVAHGIQLLKIEVQFPTTPRKFETAPRARVENLGAEISPSNAYNLSFNSYANRCTLEVPDPPLAHKISIAWTLPDVW